MNPAMRPWPTPSLYERLKASGVSTDSHESDLYFKRTPESETIVREFRDACVALETAPPIVKGFFNEAKNEHWMEALFCFDPFWQARATR